VAGYARDQAAARAAVEDVSPGVRAAGLAALARMAAIQPGDLVGALADPDPGVRRRGCDLAGRHMDAALVGPLVASLSDKVPSVAEAACYALGELLEEGTGTGPAPEAVAALALVATAHDDLLCREAAVAALGAIGSPDGLPAVLASLADKPTIRRRGVVALAAFDGEEVEAALVTATGDLDWQVRQMAEDLLDARPRRGSGH
jgi:HEAT repeat protein